MPSGRDCVLATNLPTPSASRLVFSTFNMCRKSETIHQDEQLFEVSECKPTSSLDHLDYVQVKPYDRKYHVYCLDSLFALGNREQTKCPDEVFTVPMTSTFTINDMKYVGAVIDLVLEESLDPIFMEATKIHLTPKVNLTQLAQQIDERRYHRDITHKVYNGAK